MKTKNKILTNESIYNLAFNIFNNFNDYKEYLPAAIAYSIQKNKTILQEIANDIEKARIEIIQHYGEIQQDGNFKVEEEKIALANKELIDLLNKTSNGIDGIGGVNTKGVLRKGYPK